MDWVARFLAFGHYRNSARNQSRTVQADVILSLEKKSESVRMKKENNKNKSKMTASIKKIIVFLSPIICIFLEPDARFFFGAEFHFNYLNISYKEMSVRSSGNSLKTLDLQSGNTIDNFSIFNLDYFSNSEMINAHTSILTLGEFYNSVYADVRRMRMFIGRIQEAWISWKLNQKMVLKAGFIPEYFSNLQLEQNKSPTINHRFGTSFGEVYDGSGSLGISFKRVLNKNLDLYSAVYHKVFNEPGNTFYRYMGNENSYKRNIIINLGSNYNKNSFQLKKTIYQTICIHRMLLFLVRIQFGNMKTI